jgi:hypothetical protein
MPLPDVSERLNAAIANALIREGFNFGSQVVSGEYDESVRVWTLQFTRPEQEAPVHVSLFGARNLLSSSTTLRLLGVNTGLRHAIADLLVETAPFVRVVALSDQLLLRAEFPVDLESESPVSAATVAAAVHSVASSTFRVLQAFHEQVEVVVPDRIHVPRWMEPTPELPMR